MYDIMEIKDNPPTKFIKAEKVDLKCNPARDQ